MPCLLPQGPEGTWQVAGWILPPETKALNNERWGIYSLEGSNLETHPIYGRGNEAGAGPGKMGSSVAAGESHACIPPKSMFFII